MTIHELSQLYQLNREIEMDKERLEKLRSLALTPSGPNLTGMPGGCSNENRLERNVAEIADLEAIISAKVTQCLYERNRLERYIADIPDSLTRQIFTLRFINGFSWNACAAHIGGNNTWKNLSNICYRYIEKSNDKES
ncbi:MAG: hypothetical protein HFE63_11145 [Clostridiales bacterium]|nr:hypothetical protein [Clostridiales bacterium]